MADPRDTKEEERKQKESLLPEEDEMNTSFILDDESEEEVRKFEELISDEDLSVEPERPSFWHRLLNTFFGAYKNEMEEYTEKKLQYDLAKSKPAPLQPTPEELEARRIRERFRAEVEAKNAENQKMMDDFLSYDPLSEVRSRLDEMYKSSEDASLGSRADYILINGKPLTTILFDDYFEKKHTRNGFDADLEKRMKTDPDLINKVVVEALGENKRVDCYVPDKKTGLIPEKPARFTVEMKYPARFLSYANENTPKLPDGTTAEIYARLEENGKQIQKMANREAMFVYTTGNKGMEVRKAIFGDVDLQRVKNPLNFSFDRTAAINFTRAYLVNQGYSYQDITNNKLPQNVVSDAGKVVLDKAAEGDQVWFAEQQILGRQKILKEVGAKLDSMPLEDPSEFLEPENFWVFGAADTLFDLDQEERHIKKGISEVLNDPNKPEINKEMHDHIVNASNGLFALPKEIVRGEYDSACAQLGMINKANTNALAVMSGKILFEELKNRRAESPKGLESGVRSTDLTLSPSISSAIAVNEGVSKLLNGSEKTKEAMDYQVAFCKFADKGGVNKFFKASFDEFGMCKVSVNKAVKEEAVQKAVRAYSPKATEKTVNQSRAI